MVFGYFLWVFAYFGVFYFLCSLCIFGVLYLFGFLFVSDFVMHLLMFGWLAGCYSGFPGWLWCLLEHNSATFVDLLAAVCGFACGCLLVFVYLLLSACGLLLVCFWCLVC